MPNLAEKIEQLPPELRHKAEGYVEGLLATTGPARPKGRKLKLTWAGALREYRDQYTTAELKKQMREDRIDALFE